MIGEKEFRDNGVGIYFPYVYEEHGNKLLEKLRLITLEEKAIPEIMRTARNSPRYETIIHNSERLQLYYDSVAEDNGKDRISVSDVVGLDSFHELLKDVIEEQEIEVEYRDPQNNLELFDDVCYSINKRSLIHRPENK